MACTHSLVDERGSYLGFRVKGIHAAARDFLLGYLFSFFLGPACGDGIAVLCVSVCVIQ